MPSCVGEERLMRVLFVHPSCLLYSEFYLRPEPLGLEIVAAAARQAGHAVRLCDLQVAHLTVNTPYPGTETWATESRKFTTRDYRLSAVQHAVLPTKLPLEQFYQELVRTQQALSAWHK
jgi:hypothetical protein